MMQNILEAFVVCISCCRFWKVLRWYLHRTNRTVYDPPETSISSLPVSRNWNYCSFNAFCSFCVVFLQESNLTHLRPSASSCPKRSRRSSRIRGHNLADGKVRPGHHGEFPSKLTHHGTCWNHLTSIIWCILYKYVYPFLSLLYTLNLGFLLDASWEIRLTTSTSSSTFSAFTENHWALNPDRAILEKRTGTVSGTAKTSTK